MRNPQPDRLTNRATSPSSRLVRLPLQLQSAHPPYRARNSVFVFLFPRTAHPGETRLPPYHFSLPTTHTTATSLPHVWCCGPDIKTYSGATSQPSSLAAQHPNSKHITHHHIAVPPSARTTAAPPLPFSASSGPALPQHR